MLPQGQLTDAMVAAGFPAATPAAIVQSASTPQQPHVLFSLTRICDACAGRWWGEVVGGCTWWGDAVLLE